MELGKPILNKSWPECWAVENNIYSLILNQVRRPIFNFIDELIYDIEAYVRWKTFVE